MTNILEATSFGATSTTDDVLSGVNLKGKRILVTGVSAGIGTETARAQLAAAGKPPLQWKSIPQGAATSVWAGVVAPAGEIGGSYCEDCHVASIIPDEVSISAMTDGVRAYAVDAKAAKTLWKKSEELVGESF